MARFLQGKGDRLGAGMRQNRRTSGFSFVELLLVVALIGILSAIAIPSYLGQRRRARVMGDAQANAQVLRMQLETAKADNGTYGTAGPYNWLTTGPDTAGATLLPGFTPQANSKMNYNLVIGAGGLTYTITVTDPSLAGATAYQTDQNGTTLAIMH